MEREERRRRIASRGSDRMALITGRLQSLDMDHSPAQYDSQTATTSDDHGKSDDAPTTPIKQQREEEEEESSSIMTPRISKTKTNGPDPSKRPVLIQLFNSLTPKEINSSIISSENTRVMCSTIIAILVVLSHVNLPHNVVKSKSLIAYRPLYVVLMTDLLIVAARLALYTQTREEDDDHKEQSFDGANWGGAVKVLELGLVLHQVTRAIFIDFSFYTVIVVCGLSLV